VVGGTRGGPTLCVSSPPGPLSVVFWICHVAEQTVVPVAAKPGSNKGWPRSGNRLVGFSRHNTGSVELVPRDKHSRRPVAGELSFTALACGLKSTLRP
jgi:hypothetical protein